MNLWSIESAGYEETGASAVNIPASILALLVACCYVHTGAEYLVFWGQISPFQN